MTSMVSGGGAVQVLPEGAVDAASARPWPDVVSDVADEVMRRLRSLADNDLQGLARSACVLDALACDAMADLLAEHGLDREAATLRALPVRRGDVLLLALAEKLDPETMRNIRQSIEPYLAERLGFAPPVLMLDVGVQAQVLRLAAPAAAAAWGEGGDRG